MVNKFGKLTAIEPMNDEKTVWRMKCECGVEVHRSISDLAKGAAHTCWWCDSRSRKTLWLIYQHGAERIRLEGELRLAHGALTWQIVERFVTSQGAYVRDREGPKLFRWDDLKPAAFEIKGEAERVSKIIGQNVEVKKAYGAYFHCARKVPGFFEWRKLS